LPICKLELLIWAKFRKAVYQGGEKEVTFDKAAFQNLMNGQIKQAIKNTKPTKKPTTNQNLQIGWLFNNLGNS